MRGAQAARPTPAQPSGEQPPQESWPQDVSHIPTMSIGAALAVLTKEFPAVRISKIRFLEEQGIVSPQRTASGYRSYSQADIERLRFALAAQRDSFLPLKVIRERLEDLDAQGAGAPRIGARVVTEDGGLTEAATSSSMTVEQLAHSCDVDASVIEEYVSAGLLEADFSGRFSSANKEIVFLLRTLEAEGVTPRHLKSLRHGAQRQTELIRQLTAPIRSRKKVSASAAAAQKSQELSSTLTKLYAQMVQDGVDRI